MSATCHGSPPYWILRPPDPGTRLQCSDLEPKTHFAPCIGGNSAVNSVLQSMFLTNRDLNSAMLDGISEPVGAKGVLDFLKTVSSGVRLWRPRPTQIQPGASVYLKWTPEDR